MVMLLLLSLALILEGCLGQGAAEPLTDLTFKAAVAACLVEDPVLGDCASAYGPIAGWDVSRITDMAGSWLNAAGSAVEHGSTFAALLSARAVHYRPPRLAVITRFNIT